MCVNYIQCRMKYFRFNWRPWRIKWIHPQWTRWYVVIRFVLCFPRLSFLFESWSTRVITVSPERCTLSQRESYAVRFNLSTQVFFSRISRRGQSGRDSYLLHDATSVHATSLCSILLNFVHCTYGWGKSVRIVYRWSCVKCYRSVTCIKQSCSHPIDIHPIIPHDNTT